MVIILLHFRILYLHNRQAKAWFPASPDNILNETLLVQRPNTAEVAAGCQR